MASGRSYPIRYGTKNRSQHRVRPWTSPSRDLFDKLKSSIESNSTSASGSTSLPKSTPSVQEKEGQGTLTDENWRMSLPNSKNSSDSDSPLQVKGEPTSYSKVAIMYSYSHSPR